MALRASDVDRMWTKLGFELRSGKHVVATLRVEGAIVVHTRRSHGAGKLDGRIPQFIRQQMFLKPGEFDDAVNCPMKAPDYLTILGARGKLKQS